MKTWILLVIGYVPGLLMAGLAERQQLIKPGGFRLASRAVQRTRCNRDR